MAVNTDNFGFKKPDESDFYDVQDQNGNWDIADQALEKLNNPTFEDYTEDTSVPEAVTAIEALKSKSKIGVLLSNIKAAFKGACLIGHIVNNCVTDRSDLPLSAAQGKALQDLINVLNNEQKSCISKNVVARIASLNSVAETGIYCGGFISGYRWQIGLALMQEDEAGVMFAIDSVTGNVFIANKANKDTAWKTTKIV